MNPLPFLISASFSKAESQLHQLTEQQRAHLMKMLAEEEQGSKAPKGPRYMRRAAKLRDLAASEFTQNRVRPGQCSKGLHARILRMRLHDARVCGRSGASTSYVRNDSIDLGDGNDLETVTVLQTGRMPSSEPNPSLAELQMLAGAPAAMIESETKATPPKRAPNVYNIPGWVFDELLDSGLIDDKAVTTVAIAITEGRPLTLGEHIELGTDSVRKKAIDKLRGRGLITYNRSTKLYEWVEKAHAVRPD